MKIKSAHRWIGLLACLPILIMSFTGIALVWKKELLWLTMPQAREVPSTNIEQISKSLHNIELSYATGQLLSIQIYAEDLSLYKIILKNQNYAWHDQYGTRIQQWAGNQRWENWLLDLHHRFLLGNTVGLNIAGVSSLLLIPLLIIGLFLWWPHRRRFTFKLWPHSIDQAPLQRSHSNLGVSFSAAILLISVTGAILVYPVESRKLLVEPFINRTVIAAKLETKGAEDFSDSLNIYDASISGGWQSILNHSQELYPNSTLRWVWPASPTSGKRTVGLQQSAGWNTLGQTYISFDTTTGNLLSNHNALTQPGLVRIANFTHPLHTGRLGLWYKTLLTIFGLALFCVALFALASYLKGRSNR